MAEHVIPADIRQFILNRIDSIAQLEALLLLRSDPRMEWSVEVVAQRLYISEHETALILVRLCAEGFLIAHNSQSSSYQYFPSSSRLKEIVDRLADSYSKHLVPVTNLIHGKSKNRIQEFADAFRLREEK
jgi:hypothetical protein